MGKKLERCADRNAKCNKIGGNVSPRIFPHGMFTFVCTHHVYAPRETPGGPRPSFPVELIANWFLTIEPFD